MPKSDVKPIKSNHNRGGNHGSGGSMGYDDEGRGQSKDIWEWFEENFNANPFSAWLMGLDDARCYWLLKYSTYRFGLMDIAIKNDPKMDSRARRLVIKSIKPNGEKVWDDFHAYMVAAYLRHREKQLQEQHDLAEKNQQDWAAYQAQLEAKRLRIEREDYEALMPAVDLTAGMLASDLNQAFVSKDRVGDQGEWIEDPVYASQGYDGFGFEDQQAVGTKIQITVSLDLSNSMIYNGVSAVAASAFRDIGLALKALKAEFDADLFVKFFTFSEDNWSGAGKRVTVLSLRQDDKSEYSLAEFKPFRPSQLAEAYNLHNLFDGTDTWISPLLNAIEGWEKENSDPGAVRLDLILTDAVLEHKTDIREADTIQERRNGTLTTVLLNFMPESDWLNGTLPKRCYQMKVDSDNVAGILRNVITEFVAAHI